MGLSTTESRDDDYDKNVVRAGDDVSEILKKACAQATSNTTAAKEGLIRNGKIVLPAGEGVEHELDLQTDGVGTKIRIYVAQFEHLFGLFENNELDEESFRFQVVDVWKRMLYDLYAMLVDDFRDGEAPVAITDIIAINQIEGEKGASFGTGMRDAMRQIIEETDIGIVAGETAVLGHPESTRKMSGALTHYRDSVDSILSTHGIKGAVLEEIAALRSESSERQSVILGEIEFDIGGSVVGRKVNDAFAQPQDGDVIIAFQETAKNGVIGPRSNGITRIREIMEEYAGEDWGQMTLRQLVEATDSPKKEQLEAVDPSIMDMQLWEIATGQSTLFIPFVAKELYGGKHDVVKPIHVTGNPLKKLMDGIPRGFSADINIQDAPIPQIIRICQILSGMDDEAAMKKWNMGIPYAVIVRADQADQIIEKASTSGLTARKAGTITATQEGNDSLHLHGIGGHNISKTQERERKAA